MIIVQYRTLPSVHRFAVGQHDHRNYNASGSLLTKSEYCHALYVNVKELIPVFIGASVGAGFAA